MLVNGTAGAEPLAAFSEFQFWVLSSVYVGHVSNPARVVSMIFRRGYPTHGFHLVVTVCNESGFHAPALVIWFCVGLRAHWAVRFFPPMRFWTWS